MSRYLKKSITALYHLITGWILTWIIFCSTEIMKYYNLFVLKIKEKFRKPAVKKTPLDKYKEKEKASIKPPLLKRYELLIKIHEFVNWRHRQGRHLIARSTGVERK